jgi:hypothetical protein
LAFPGGAALIIRIINPLLYESVEKSALNSAYSIVMSLWAILFVIVTSNIIYLYSIVLEKKD